MTFRSAAAALLGSLLLAVPAQAEITPGVGIAGVKVEDTQAQVRALHGEPSSTGPSGENTAWHYSALSLTVIFRPAATAEHVLTLSPTERTATGVGPGSTVAEVQAAYPDITCQQFPDINDCYLLHADEGRTIRTAFLSDTGDPASLVHQVSVFVLPGPPPPAAPQPVASPAPPPPAVPAPAGAEVGKAFAPAAVTGQVYVKQADGTFRPLQAGERIPDGSEIDARKGSVAIKVALTDGTQQQGKFGGGLFVLDQRDDGRSTTALLKGPATCARGSRTPATQQFRAKASRSLQSEAGRGFLTRGLAATAAPSKGSTWLTEDTCDGTRVTVTKGAVDVAAVRGKAKPVSVRPGQAVYVTRQGKVVKRGSKSAKRPRKKKQRR